ncbi:hypothetical protein SAMN05216244_1430 [Sediminibacillus halophilus]|uniref:Uncharacterized protein n=1 Tax=Sediminibacillus halophilus TaxID=482461 RepID=A0A1G9PJ10_9BACI|nr:hypothetical protein SAMN05216244_1430 [Sediminibacillus halophilus]
MKVTIITVQDDMHKTKNHQHNKNMLMIFEEGAIMSQALHLFYHESAIFNFYLTLACMLQTLW